MILKSMRDHTAAGIVRALVEDEDEEIDYESPKDFLVQSQKAWGWNMFPALPEGLSSRYHVMVLRDGRVTSSNYLNPGDYIRYKNGKGQSFVMRLEALSVPPGHYTPDHFQLSQNEREPFDQVWSVHVQLPGRDQPRKITEVRADRFVDAVQKCQDAAERVLGRLGSQA